MAIPFLQHIDLNKNELQNAVVQNLGTAPSTPKEGQIYYHTSDDTIYLNTSADSANPSWKSLGGDITGVTVNAGEGLEVEAGSASATSGAFSVTLGLEAAVAGNGLSYSSGVLAVGVDDSSIELSSDAVRVKALGITNAMLAGSIANAKLANSTISGKALGTNLSALTVDNTTLQLNSGTTYNGSAALTISGKTAAIADGGAALATADQIHTFVTTQTDDIAADTTGNAATATLATTVTVTEDTASNTNFNVVYHNGSNALLDESSGGGFYYNPSTEQLTVKNLNVTVKTTQKEVELINTSSGVIFEGDTADGNETTLDVIDPTADRSILLPNNSGTVALTSDLVGNEKITKKLSGDGSNTTYSITHGFGTPIVQVQVLHYGDNGSGATYDVVHVEIERDTDNAVDIIFGTAPTAAEDYLVLISKFPAIS